MRRRARKEIPASFEHALREWGRRDPRTAPVVAAARVRERLGSREPERRCALPFAGWATAAAVLVTIVAGLWVASRGPEITETTFSNPPPEAAVATPPLGDNVVLWWLDPETPVYFVLKRSAT